MAHRRPAERSGRHSIRHAPATAHLAAGRLIDLGLEPHLLSETLIEHVFESIERHKDRVLIDHIEPTTTWLGGFRGRIAVTASC